MRPIPSIVQEAEGLVRELVDALTRPRPRECLCCYVARLLLESPCDGTHRHSLRYRDTMAPRATALVERLSRVGACCCDCELFLNGYQPRFLLDRVYDGEEDDLEVDELPPCAGVRRGSVQPCRNWVRVRRW